MFKSGYNKKIYLTSILFHGLCLILTLNYFVVTVLLVYYVNVTRTSISSFDLPILILLKITFIFHHLPSDSLNA